MSTVPEQDKVKYSGLKVGYQFPPARYRLDAAMVAAYLQAVDETNSLFQDSGIVPPLAVAAFAMRALSQSLSLPAGAIHVSQEFEFINTTTTGDSLTSYATVTRKQDRGKMHLLTIDLNVVNQQQKAVLAGKTSFVLPESDNRQ